TRKASRLCCRKILKKIKYREKIKYKKGFKMSKVFWSKEISEANLGALLDAAGIASVVRDNHLAAIKIHFGEEGNLGYVRPNYVRVVADKIKTLGAKPFLTDANTIYVGSRADAVSHTLIALKHGFTVEATGAPVLIADGLRGNAGVDVEVNLKHFKTVSVANSIYYADSIVFVSHFKGHELAGFGGALKNAGMGCATREGKYKQHNSVVPSVKRESCTGCASCVPWCPSKALELSPGDGFIVLDSSQCVGCGECILSCPSDVFSIPWNAAAAEVQEKMMEYAYGALKNKKCLYVNFINHVTKFCDCYATKEKPFFDEIGLAASTDPVALDVACAEAVNKEFGQDFFRHIFPSIDSTAQLDCAERLGLGERKYELVVI
ncbi:MAG: DUF362 domain-containing protein, partial [Endomicrobiia bacterium]|nr:DUF362 domain-containing protein [Endomicrobiia bacterium]